MQKIPFLVLSLFAMLLAGMLFAQSVSEQCARQCCNGAGGTYAGNGICMTGQTGLAIYDKCQNNCVSPQPAPPPPAPEPCTPRADVVAGQTDSGARFTSISREVEFRADNQLNGWRPAMMDTALHVCDHVRTSEDSEAIIGFADLSTFLLKAESEIVISTPPATDSKLKLLAGKIWVNIKKMIHNGTMEVEMSQAVAGIKGTQLICSDDGNTSTVKVIEGTITFTSKATGQTVNVSTGETVSATSAGLSQKTTFNISTEEASWQDLLSQESNPTTTSPGNAASSFCGLPFILTALGIITLFIRKRGTSFD